MGKNTQFHTKRIFNIDPFPPEIPYVWDTQNGTLEIESYTLGRQHGLHAILLT